MTLAALLTELQRRGVRLARCGDRLRWTPKAAVDDALRMEMAHHKRRLLRIADGSRLRWSDDVDAEERCQLAALIRKARHGEFPRVCIPDADRPEIVLRDPNRAIQAAVRMRCPPFLRALTAMHARGLF